MKTAYFNKSIILLLFLSLINIHCSMGSNCDAGEVAKAFIEAHIKRDFDSFMKYEGR